MQYFRRVIVLTYRAVNRPHLFLLLFDSGIHQPMKACDYLRFVELSFPTQKGVFLEPSKLNSAGATTGSRRDSHKSLFKMKPAPHDVHFGEVRD